MKDLDRAFQNFFAGRASYPTFKKKGRGESFRFPQPSQIRLDQANSRLQLPKIGWVRYRNSRPVTGELRKMSRKARFSQNWKKAKAKVCHIHSAIANARRDFLHKTTTTLSKNHALVAIEDLRVRNMSASAKGTAAEPGKNVRQKSGLNRAILDQGWGEFRRQLDYKLTWNGGWLVAVPPRNTSRTCPCCGHVAAGNRPSQAVFLCQECWYENHADAVGAINILDRALAMLASEPGEVAAPAGTELNEGPDPARIACEVSGAAIPPAAGTRREYAPG